jgi:hypothetical protein
MLPATLCAVRRVQRDAECSFALDLKMKASLVFGLDDIIL